jgi:hypothetical protein
MSGDTAIIYDLDDTGIDVYASLYGAINELPITDLGRRDALLRIRAAINAELGGAGAADPPGDFRWADDVTDRLDRLERIVDRLDG